MLARAQQDVLWDRTQAHNRLRSHLREYYSGFLAAFAAAKGGIMRPEARALLAAAPIPADTTKLIFAQLRALLKKAGRSRGIDAETQRLRGAFRQEQMRQPALVEQAVGRQSLASLRRRVLNQHPDAGITSFPGIGTLTGTRVLAEIGDDLSHSQDARGLKPTPGQRPSLAPAARPDPSPGSTSRTNGSLRQATSGHSLPSPHHLTPAPTTTGAGPTAT